jgi:hypothetical protein
MRDAFNRPLVTVEVEITVDNAQVNIFEHTYTCVYTHVGGLEPFSCCNQDHKT